eukprot:TRINITY_DN37497_c0_g1_i1.p1 TRINITY_DN37497_c0_g1~~TRINITY_DN37497_c0_g1_i1.p1  ORF type:complete len:528 (-),score=41.55 TRINITY_DN37497_c0_g1_i1:72-1655(-)
MHSLDNRTLARSRLTSSNSWILVRDITGFDGCEELCRASPLHSIMQKVGHIFMSAKGSASTYDLSEETDRIFAFLSHNWSVSRFKKFIALSYHFNLLFGLVCAFLVLVPIGVLSALGLVPTVESAYRKYSFGFLGRLCCIPVFIISLLFVPDIKLYFGRRGPLVFLDKTCIHQENPEVMRMGIEKLAAFLHRSDRMVVLYTAEYLRKLWTVYEIASFLIMRDHRHIDVVSIYQTLNYFVGIILIWVTCLLKLLARSFVPVDSIMFFGIQCYVGGFLYCYSLRVWMRERAAIYERLESFDVKKCICTVEADRPLVYRNIAVLMRASGRVTESSDEVALESFNKLVRVHLPKAFSDSLGTLSFKYTDFACLLMFFFIPVFLDDLPFIRGGSSPVKNALWHGFGYMFASFVLGPLCVFSFDYFARRRTDLKGWIDFAYFLLVFHIGFVVPFAVIFHFRQFLRIPAFTSISSLALIIVMHGLVAIFAYLMFSFHGVSCSRRRPKSASGNDSAQLDIIAADERVPPRVMETE